MQAASTAETVRSLIARWQENIINTSPYLSEDLQLRMHALLADSWRYDKVNNFLIQSNCCILIV